MTALNVFREIESGEVGNTSFIRDTLIRLMDGLPLTPIDDDPENWVNTSDKTVWVYSDGEIYQCTRYPSLYKTVLQTGEVRSEDHLSIICVDDSEKNIFHPIYQLDSNGFSVTPAEIVVNELLPITLPYIPSKKLIKVVCSYSDDLFWVKRIIDRKGNIITINRFYQLVQDRPRHVSWAEIGKTKYYRLLKK